MKIVTRIILSSIAILLVSIFFIPESGSMEDGKELNHEKDAVELIEQTYFYETHEEPKTLTQEEPKTLTQEEQIDKWIEDICLDFNVDPYLVKSIVYQESRYKPDAEYLGCVGLMQLSIKWHSARAKELGVTDLYDPKGNILVGVDYLSRLFSSYSDPGLVLMIYNMGTDRALSIFEKGELTEYAETVLNRAEKLRSGG